MAIIIFLNSKKTAYTNIFYSKNYSLDSNVITLHEVPKVVSLLLNAIASIAD